MRSSTSATRVTRGPIAAFILLVVSLGYACLAVAQEPAPSSLSNRQIKAIESAMEAHFQGNTRQVLKSLVQLTDRLERHQVEEVDALLGEHNLPPLRSLLADARGRMLAQGFASQLPRVSPLEAVILLPELEHRLKARIETLRTEEVMGDPLPKPEVIEKYETLFESVRALYGQVRMIKSTAEYMRGVVGSLSSRRVARLDEADQEVLRNDYHQWIASVDALHQEIAEREIEMRVDRLELAVRQLEQPSLDKQKFLAAAAWVVDAAAVTGFLQSRLDSTNSGKRRAADPEDGVAAPDERFMRDRLNDPALLQHVRDQADQAKSLAGDLTTKARLLSEGINWWIRGRYGIGPSAFGLAKSPQAMVSPIAQMGLYMPLDAAGRKNRARAEGRTESRPEPLFDRRHHYWWAWEDRRVQRDSSSRDGYEKISWTGSSTDTIKTYW